MPGKKKKDKEKSSDTVSLEDLNSKVNLLKNLSIGFSPLKKDITALKKAISNGDDKASNLSGKVFTGLDGLLEKWNRKRAEILLDIADRGIQIMDERKIDSKKLKNKIEEIRKKSEKTGAEEYLKSISKLRSDLAKSLKKQKDVALPEAWSAFEKGINSFIDIAGTDASLKEPKKYYKRLLKYASKHDYDNLLIYSNLLHNSVQNEMSEDIVKDRFNAIEEDIKRLRKQIEEFKEMGIDSGGLERELHKLDDTMDPKHFAEVQNTVTYIEKSVSRIEKEYNRKKGHIQLIEVSDILGNYGGLLDFGDTSDKYQKLMDDETTISPKKFQEESTTILDTVKETLFSNFEPQVKERIESLDMSLTGSSIEGGVELDQIQDLRELAVTSLKDGNITEALEYLSLAENIIGQSEGEVRFRSLKNRYIDFLNNYENLIDEDLEIEELKGMVTEIEGMFLDDDIKTGEINGLMDEAEGAMKGKLVEVRKMNFDRVNDDMLDIFQRIDIPKKKKADFDKRLTGIGDRLETIEEGDYRKNIGDLQIDVDKVVSNYFKDHYSEWVDKIDHSLGDLKEQGVDISNIEEELKLAGDSYEDNIYLKTGDLLRSVSDEISNIELEIETKNVEDHINSAEFLFEEAKRAGVDIQTDDDLLTMAKEGLHEGDLKTSMQKANEFEELVKRSWMDKKRDILREDIDSLKTYLDDSLSAGLEIGEVDSLINEAELLFKDENFEEVSEIVEKVKGTITSERSQFFSEGAMKGITNIKDEIRSMSDLGVNTLESETLLIEAERLFMNEDYETSYSMTLDIRELLNMAREDHLSETVPKKMKEVLGEITKLEVMGLDTGAARDFANTASQLMNQGDFVNSLAEIDRAKEITEEMYKSHISLTIPETLVEVKKQVDMATGEGIELTEVEDLLQNAEKMFMNENYDQALETIQMAQGTFDDKKNDFYKNKFINGMEGVQTMIGEASGLDVELELTQDNINMARDAFERGDFQSSHVLLEKVSNFLEKSMIERDNSKRKDIVANSAEEIRTLINVASEENIDTNQSRDMMSLVYELMDQGDFEQAEHIIEGIKNDINDRRLQTKKHLIESSIKTTEILLKNMANMGIDVFYEQSLMSDLKEALRMGDLDLCDTINGKLEESLQENKTPFVSQKVRQDISRLKSRINEAKRSGVDTSSLTHLVPEAITQYDSGDIEGAQEIVKKGNDLLDAAMKVHTEGEYGEMVEELRQAIDRMGQLGVPTEDEEMLLNQSSDLAEAGEIDEAVNWIKTGLIGADAKISSFQRTTAEGYIPHIESYLGELRAKDIDVSDLEKIFQEGLQLHEEGDDEKAVSRFSSILELGEELRTLHEDQQISNMFKTSNIRFQEMIKLGLKPSKELKSMRKRLKDILSTDDFSPDIAKQMFQEFRGRLDDEGSGYMEALSKKHIAQVSNLFKEMMEKGKVDDQIKDMIREMGNLHREGKFEQADRIALATIEAMESLSREEFEELVRQELTSVKQMLSRLKSMGSNVSKPEQLITRVDVALNDSKVDQAQKLIKSIKKAIKEIVKRNMRESSKETIEFTESLIHYLIDNFSGISQKLLPAEEKLHKAREMFAKKKYKTAQKLAAEATKMAEEVDLSNIKQFLFVFRSMQAEEAMRDVTLRMQELAQKGIDISKAKVLYKEAQDQFGADRHEKGREMITLTRILMSELDQQSLREQAFDELNTAHVEILTQKRKGSNIQHAYRTYQSAKDSFSLQGYKKSILLAKKATFQAKSAKKAA